MVHLLAAGGAAIVALRCPHCGQPQARARGHAATIYACKACRRTFTLGEALHQERRR